MFINISLFLSSALSSFFWYSVVRLLLFLSSFLYAASVASMSSFSMSCGLLPVGVRGGPIPSFVDKQSSSPLDFFFFSFFLFVRLVVRLLGLLADRCGSFSSFLRSLKCAGLQNEGLDQWVIF